MPLNPVFKITVKKGQVIVQNQEKRMHYIRSLADGEYEEIIRKPRKPRSKEQNSYLHGVILKMIEDETGEGKERVKSSLKNKFLSYETKIGTATRDTSDLSTVEFESFNENCRRWAAEFLHMYIPLPNEVDWSNFDEIV